MYNLDLNRSLSLQTLILWLMSWSPSHSIALTCRTAVHCLDLFLRHQWLVLAGRLGSESEVATGEHGENTQKGNVTGAGRESVSTGHW
jgi:hypothetical protein